MPVRFLSDAQRDALSAFPAKLDADELDRFVSLSTEDITGARSHRGDANRLGWALQLCGLRMLGFCPNDVTSAPAEVIAFLARQLDIDPTSFVDYGVRSQTRTDHEREVMDYVGFRVPSEGDLDDLLTWTAEQALLHDRPIVLFDLACVRLRELRFVRPGVTVLEQRIVGTAREAARTETYRRVSGLLTTERQAVLDGLLAVDAKRNAAPATWLRQLPPRASANAMLDEIDKLVFLRDLGVENWDTSALAPKRVAAMARWVGAASNQALAQSSSERRYPALVAFCSQRLVQITDGLVDLFDRLLTDVNSTARRKLGELQQSTARSANDKVLLLTEIARVLLDPELDDATRLTTIFERVSKDRLLEALADCERIARPADDRYVDFLGDHYSRLRQCVPRLIEVLALRSNRADDDVLEGLETLRELNRSRLRKVPTDAPLTFVPKAWMSFVLDDTKHVSRRYWELALLWRLRERLRSGDIWLDHSLRYADPETYLLDQTRWDELRPGFCELVRAPKDGITRIAERKTELDELLASFATMLDGKVGPVRLEDGHLVVPRDVGDEVPESVIRLEALASQMLPSIELAELLIEVDSWCEFSRHLTHAAGSTTRSPDMLTNLYAAILAQATNLGPTKMAASSGLSYEQLAHATAWYLREETLTAAIDVVINHHHRLPIARLWGDGTFSSSDGQRFPIRVKAPNAVALPRYFGMGRGVTVYTWVADHYTTYSTKVIESTVRDATYVLDGIFDLADRDSELDITEHTTDTAGYTDLVFALFDLVDLTFSPRIRDLADQRLWRLADTVVPESIDSLLRQRIDTGCIVAHWDDMLRLACSIREGTATASLLISKLQAHPRQNALTKALQEYGRLTKTIFILRYLQDPAYRRRVGRQLNKGETLHALRKDISYANQGTIRHRRPDDQADQTACLSLVVNAVALWNAVYLTEVVSQLRCAGVVVDDDDLSHLGPTISKHINVHGRYHFDVDHQSNGLRPLREVPQSIAH